MSRLFRMLSVFPAFFFSFLLLMLMPFAALQAANSSEVRLVPQTGHSSGVTAVAWSPDGKRVVSGSDDDTIKFWNANSGKLLATRINFKDSEWIAFTPDHYYRTSPNGEKYISFRVGDQIYKAEKYAHLYKRPDIVMARLAGKKETRIANQRVEKGLKSVGRGKKITPIPQWATNKAQNQFENSWAVLIGVDQYPKGSGYAPLPHAKKDVQAVKKTLIRNLKFNPRHIHTLIGPEATRRNIERLLGTTLPKKVKKEDRVIIYFSGHGDTIQDRHGREQGYWIPINGEKDDLYSSAVSATRIHELSDRLPAQQVLFVVDACYSGIYGSKRHKSNEIMPVATKQQVVDFIESGGRQILTAGTAGQKAWGGRSEWNNMSVFTYYFVEGIKGYAESKSDEDDVVTISELKLFLDENVPRDTNGEQTPQLNYLSTEAGQFVFYKEGDLN